jgi:DNA-binding NtrC family response regulator
MSNKTEVLIVDDEPIVCERFKDYLEKKDMSVETFTVSQEALDRLQEKAFDVIVTDIKMEGPTGIDILVAAKNMAPAPEVILITGYGSFESYRTAETVGAFDYVHKPFKVEEVYKKIEKAAAKAKRHSK